MLELGHVSKAHGLAGDAVVSLITDRTGERMASGAVLHLGPSADRAQPFTVVTAKPYQDKWLVRFAGVDGREAADQLRGSKLFAAPLSSEELLDDDVIFVHELIGKRVVDQHGTDHGEVLSVVDNPAADLLELANDRLVPLSFYVSNDDEIIVVDVPVGLLDDGAVSERDPDISDAHDTDASDA